MADGRVRINKEVMQTAINNYKIEKGEMIATCYKMSDVVRQLDGAWDGVASEHFKSQFDSMFGNLRQCEDEINQFITNLEAVLAQYRGTEVDIQTLFENLPEGTVYTNDSAPTAHNM